tara:strand:+ start:89 stop:445 length:357 start_codon:yes stop_codon:yes gene_type:complete
MKKYIILLIIPLLFFSTGCEKEEIVDGTLINTDLIGTWKCETWCSDGYEYKYLIFFGDGTFNSTEHDGDITCTDIWSVTDNYVTFCGFVREFQINGIDRLKLTHLDGDVMGIWEKLTN